MFNYQILMFYFHHLLYFM